PEQVPGPFHPAACQRPAGDLQPGAAVARPDWRRASLPKRARRAPGWLAPLPGVPAPSAPSGGRVQHVLPQTRVLLREAVCGRAGIDGVQPCPLVPGPPLVAAAVARPQLDQRAVAGACPTPVEAEPRLGAGDRAVSVEVPLLVGRAVTRPDIRLGAGAGALAVGVQARAAVDPQLTRGGRRPLLVGAAVAVPQLHLGAGGLRGAGYVHAAPGVGPDDRGGRAAGAAPAARCDGQVVELHRLTLTGRVADLPGAPGVVVRRADRRAVDAGGDGAAREREGEG